MTETEGVTVDAVDAVDAVETVETVDPVVSLAAVVRDEKLGIVESDSTTSDEAGSQPKPPSRDEPVGLSAADIHSPSPEYLAALRTLGIKPDGSVPRRSRAGLVNDQPVQVAPAVPQPENQPRPPVDSVDSHSRDTAVPAAPQQPAPQQPAPLQQPVDTGAIPAQPTTLNVDRAVEAILMVADEPQSLVSIASAISKPVAVVRQAVERLVDDFNGVGGTIRRGFELREVGGGWRIYVRPDFDFVVTDFVSTQNPSRLSQAALETLAVIAYKQPITRGAIASIRAVNVDSVVRTLLGRGLITEVSTDAETHALMYGTTDLVLNQLGLNSLDELPPISPLLNDGAEGFNERL